MTKLNSKENTTGTPIETMEEWNARMEKDLDKTQGETEELCYSFNRDRAIEAITK